MLRCSAARCYAGYTATPTRTANLKRIAQMPTKRWYSAAAVQISKEEGGNSPAQKVITNLVGANLRKKFLIHELNRTLVSSTMVAVLQHHSLSVEEMMAFRETLKAKNLGFTIVRNKLTRKALEGTEYEQLSTLFRSTTCIVFSSEPAVKDLIEILKTEKKMILLGVHVDSLTLDVAQVKEYIKLPSLEDQRAQILSLINQPAQLLASLLTRGPQELVSLLQRHADEANQDKEKAQN